MPDLTTKEATLLNTSGEDIGTLTFTEGENGVVIMIEAENMPEGTHSFHIHETASCTTESEFKSAGGHLNPNDVPHGFYAENGPHPGDLPNIHVSADGTVTAEVYNDYVTLSADKTDMVNLLDEDGSAIMIHENPDDYMTQPTGGGGARIACAEVKAD